MFQCTGPSGTTLDLTKSSTKRRLLLVTSPRKKAPVLTKEDLKPPQTSDEAESVDEEIPPKKKLKVESAPPVKIEPVPPVKDVYNYKHVQKWTRNLSVPLLHHHLILVPIHKPGHWVLGAVLTEFEGTKNVHKFVYLDSLKGEDENFYTFMQRYVEDEYKDKRGMYTHKREFKSRDDQEVPHQSNGYDCGVWVCINAFCLIHKIHPSVFKNRTEWFRKHIFHCITKNEVVDDIISFQE